MNIESAWLAASATVAVLLAYEVSLAVAQRQRPARIARTAHANLRGDWFEAVSAQKGSEVLAVQTLRNALMSASMSASTAALGLMGTVTLAVPSLHGEFSDAAFVLPHVTPRLVMELVLLALLFASLVSSIMAVRYYNHASFVGGMPVESDARERWAPAGTAYVRKAGILYSWGLRQFVLVAPVVAFILHPVAGPIGAVLVAGVLLSFDRFQPGALTSQPRTAG
ncbi:MAG: DUF599 domain-containing protein [Pseudomonadota bacterium]|nr:DUF599 domain-containing protein [Pseudomonadota bacterium]